MDEEIKNILSDETLDENAKVEKLKELQDKTSKEYVGNSYIPREKYNEQKTKYEQSYKELKAEYDSYKQSKMTDEEKAQELQAKREAELRDANKEIAKLTAESIFKGNGLKEEDYGSFMNMIEVMDKENAAEFANNLTKLISNQKDLQTTKIEKDIVKNTPTPQVGGETVKSDSQIAAANLAKAREGGNKEEIAYYLKKYQETLN